MERKQKLVLTPSLLREYLQNPTFFTVMRELCSALSGCRTVLDIGCGSCSAVRYFHGLQCVGVEGHPKAAEEARRNQTHSEIISGDIRELKRVIGERTFDACVALDVIEHLEKSDGWKLLDSMESIAKKKVIIFTPNGFLPQEGDENELQRHLSGWTAEDLYSRGYRVVGMCGPKRLRGEHHRITKKPRAFWLVVSLLAHYCHTRNHPQKAAAIFGTRVISKAGERNASPSNCAQKHPPEQP